MRERLNKKEQDYAINQTDKMKVKKDYANLKVQTRWEEEVEWVKSVLKQNQTGRVPNLSVTITVMAKINETG